MYFKFFYRLKTKGKLILKKVNLGVNTTRFQIILLLFFMLFFANPNLAQTNSATIDSLSLLCTKGHIQSCELLKNIAISKKNPKVIRIKAAEKITDQNTLGDIVRKLDPNSDENWDVLRAAVKRITDQNILVDIAKNNKTQAKRILCVLKITDQNALADIALNDAHMYNRAASINKITDQNVLADIAMNDSKTYVREKAVKKITDQNILLNIAKNGKYIDPRLIAINNLNEFEYYGQLIEIINQNIKTNKNLASIGALKVIPKDKNLNINYKVLEIIVEIDYESQTYSGDGDLWERYDFNIEIKTNKFSKSYFFGGEKGDFIESSESDFETIHFGFIDINQICEVLLSPFSKEDLLNISEESDVYYLRETAKNMLKNK